MSQKPPPQQQNDGRNEYIPSYISKAPFYAEGLSDGDYLEHQRLHATPKDTLDKAKWYDRGKRAGPAATKYRKGACENCGAITHKAKDCLERPRKLGAKWTGRDIQADEVVSEVKLGWDAKRDRWNGYDSREYSAVVKEYEEIEKLKQEAAAISMKEKNANNGEDASIDDASEAKYAEETDMGRSQPTSTRQLRLREDTAKYLINLDLDSARYDPKTRSMDTTSQSLSNNPSDSIAEEGFVRPSETSDDAAAFERAQKYAWETQDSASINSNQRKLHLQANPTEGEILLKKRTLETTTKQEAQRKALIEKYGEQAHLPGPSSTTSAASGQLTTRPNKAITSSESYTEYDKHGNPKLAPGQLKAKARSKYPEDIMINNHTSVFGSWWSNFQWGYACCHSMVKNSYCTGDAGRAAFEEAEGLRTGQGLIEEQQNADNSDKENGRKDQDSKNDGDNNDNNNNNVKSGTNGLDRKKESNAHATGRNKQVAAQKGGKRTFADVTEEELEAYKRNKVAANDPVNAWDKLGTDGLLSHDMGSR